MSKKRKKSVYCKLWWDTDQLLVDYSKYRPVYKVAHARLQFKIESFIIAIYESGYFQDNSTGYSSPVDWQASWRDLIN